MSYNTRAGVRMNRPSYGSGGGSGGGGYGGGGGGNYHGNQNSNYSQPAYSTPPSNYQNKNDSRQSFQGNQSTPGQKMPQQPPPLQQPPAPPMLKDPPAPVQPPQPPQQPTPEPKVENDDKNQDNSMDTSEDGQEGTGTPRGRPKFRPWNKKGAPGVKITRKMRKRRQNARLRNLLAPKNAMMVLHELHPELKMVITETVNAANQTAYTVEIEVEGKIYRGHGMSKMAAKQAASENALKAVLLEKLEKNNLKINPDNTLSSENTNANAPPSAAPPTEDVVMKEEGPGAGGASAGEEEGGSAPRRRPVEDDVPWGSLASFALFKLFSEWQSQGFQLPPSGLPPVFHKATGAKKIPEDAKSKHPVQLLNQIRPGSQYSESREGTPPNLTFKFTVVIDGQTFQGVGTNKKDAKKECAKHALEALGVKYD